jgi:hypothetical protein
VFVQFLHNVSVSQKSLALNRKILTLQYVSNFDRTARKTISSKILHTFYTTLNPFLRSGIYVKCPNLDQELSQSEILLSSDQRVQSNQVLETRIGGGLIINNFRGRSNQDCSIEVHTVHPERGIMVHRFLRRR